MHYPLKFHSNLLEAFWVVLKLLGLIAPNQYCQCAHEGILSLISGQYLLCEKVSKAKQCIYTRQSML